MPVQVARYQPHVDGLRAVAVLAVLLFHLKVPGCAGGFVGVDVFLVISGFLITRLIVAEIDLTGDFRFGHFYLRRVRRLAPALIATTLATVIAGTLLFAPGTLARTGRDLIASTLSFANVRFWLAADYFDVSAHTKPLLHTWSLSLEEQFYLLWPAFLYLAYRARAKRVLPAVFLVIAAVSLLLNPLFGSGAPAWLAKWLPGPFADGKSTVFFLLPFRVFEFTIGGMLVWTTRWKPARAWVSDSGLVLGLALIVAATVAFHEELLFPSFPALVPCLGAALAIQCGGRSRLHAVLTNPVAVGVGLMSYSLYLVHWPLIVCCRYAGGPLAATDRLWVGALSLLLGYASYRLVEAPFRRRSLPLWPVGLAAPVVLALGLHLAWSGGWTWRVSPAIAVDLSASGLEFHREQYGGAGYAQGPLCGKGPPDVLLIGDSHGKQYAEGADRELGAPYGLSVHMRAGESCLYLPGFARTTPGVDWKTVLATELRSIAATVAAGDPKPVVLVAQAWLSQSARAALVDADGRPANRGIDPRDFVAGLARLKEQAGIEHLVVIGNVPLPAVQNLFEELTKPRLTRRLRTADAATFAESEEVRGLNAALKEGAARTGAYVYLDPHDVLCHEGRCLAIAPSGELVYSDATHLSRFGSRLVMRAFAPKILEVVRSRQPRHSPARSLFPGRDDGTASSSSSVSAANGPRPRTRRRRGASRTRTRTTTTKTRAGAWLARAMERGVTAAQPAVAAAPRPQAAAGPLRGRISAP